ncbi:phosphotriesterase family protein [Streptantibioticus ferralitis]|uniref:Phosphotriesterase n=1 Tax=Streptantibioticus ferralitis TaxID=236510 RepID=A0ABT5Z2J0_9ACTN|nr:phosphotriesterase [Streptantibioticus ferralitis]MDF2258037.1 phosphotriesterase [Streptantibioticus ferralitis]
MEQTTQAAAVRTVLGDIPAAELGVCDAHDHLFFRSPLLPGQELTDPLAATRELRAFRELGGRAVVQWSPFGTGRRTDALPRVSRDAGVHVIAATGLHQAAHCTPGVLDRVMDRLAELFVAELTEGVRQDEDPDGPAEPVRAGLIKVAGAFHGLDTHARRVMAAAAEAHHATGAPIAVHHELGTAPLDVLGLLCGELEVPAAKVVLGHLNRSPDLRVHREAARSGAFLAFDGPSRANHATDWRLFDALVALAEAGHTDQVLIGGDTTTAAARAATGGGPGIPFLLRVLRPRIARELGEQSADAFFVANPARAFATHWH